MTALVWLRRDLRLSDNPALHAALSAAKPVTAVYIDCPAQWDRHGVSPAQRDFIARNLQTLRMDLSGCGIRLHRLTVPGFADIPQRLSNWCQQKQISQVYANAEIPLDEQQRDRAVAQRLQADGIGFELSEADCVIQPGRLTTASGGMFKVFTPFRRAWLAELQRSGYRLLPVPGSCRATEQTPVSRSGDWPAGERAAQARLEAFCREQLTGYQQQRDYPAQDGTSSLSPYLAIGVLSVNQCLAAMENRLGYLPLSPGEPGFGWLNELVWREFYRHLLADNPALCRHQPFKADTAGLGWREVHQTDAAEDFRRWSEGQTGFPLVDAAMRCLNQTHWLHNRLRMVVASFLTRDLHIDWRAGEQYFMSQLIDGDFASNNGGWQWSAGTGADAAPYFRIFNPTRQSERFDAGGRFIRRWLPELKSVPDKQLHAPRSWLDSHQPQNPYPAPMVDHCSARQVTLSLFSELKAANQAADQAANQTVQRTAHKARRRA